MERDALYAAAADAPKLNRTDLRAQFLREILKTQPHPYQVALIYALLLPPMPSPSRDSLTWLTRDTAPEVISDGILLRAAPTDRARGCTRAVYTDVAPGRYTVVPGFSGPPSLGRQFPVSDAVITHLQDLIPDTYSGSCVRTPLNIVWFDEEQLEGALYQVQPGVYVRAWIWGLCAGRASVRVHADTHLNVQGGINYHTSAVFIEAPQRDGSFRYARIAQAAPPVRTHPYIANLSKVAKKVCAGRLPMKRKVSRHIYNNVEYLQLSDEFLVALFRYCI